MIKSFINLKIASFVFILGVAVYTSQITASTLLDPLKFAFLFAATLIAAIQTKKPALNAARITSILVLLLLIALPTVDDNLFFSGFSAAANIDVSTHSGPIPFWFAAFHSFVSYLIVFSILIFYIVAWLVIKFNKFTVRKTEN